MTLQTGDKLPEGKVKKMGAEGPEEVTLHSLLAGKKIALFGVPGAFTPGCHKTHLPGYVANADSIKDKGFDDIICLAVNDVYVMDAWGNASGAAGKVTMVADGSAKLTKAMGLELDLTNVGMGLRCKRFSMVVNDGVVESINIDAKSIDATTAENTCGLN
ncbi:MAG: peroxiredoxin [Myxococcota bacterium]|nr:peroxiredoxin [Myxococcota bacterium]